MSWMLVHAARGLAAVAVIGFARETLADAPPAPLLATTELPPTWGVSFNALAPLAARFGIDVQHEIAPHHVVVVNPHGDYSSHDFPSLLNRTVRGAGLELGYRYFPAGHGLAGVFIGGSVCGGAYTVRVTPDIRGAFDDYDTTIWTFCAAIDVGLQIVIGGRVLITVGGGAAWNFATTHSPDTPDDSGIVIGSGPRARVLLSAGWAF